MQLGPRRRSGGVEPRRAGKAESRAGSGESRAGEGEARGRSGAAEPPAGPGVAARPSRLQRAARTRGRGSLVVPDTNPCTMPPQPGAPGPQRLPARSGSAA